MNKSAALILFLLSVLSAASAFASEGDLDTTFNVNGKVIACCGQSPGRSVAIQSDGKIVTAGITRNPSTFIFQIWLIRYEANGTLDTGFGTNGEVKTDTVADNDGNIGQNVPLAIQADGKIVVAVWASGLSGNGAFVYRYDANGTLDTSFDGVTDIILTTLFATTCALSVAILSAKFFEKLPFFSNSSHSNNINRDCMNIQSFAPSTNVS